MCCRHFALCFSNNSTEEMDTARFDECGVEKQRHHIWQNHLVKYSLALMKAAPPSSVWQDCAGDGVEERKKTQTKTPALGGPVLLVQWSILACWYLTVNPGWWWGRGGDVNPLFMRTIQESLKLQQNKLSSCFQHLLPPVKIIPLCGECFSVHAPLISLSVLHRLQTNWFEN